MSGHIIDVRMQFSVHLHCKLSVTARETVKGRERERERDVEAVKSFSFESDELKRVGSGCLGTTTRKQFHTHTHSQVALLQAQNLQAALRASRAATAAAAAQHNTARRARASRGSAALLW